MQHHYNLTFIQIATKYAASRSRKCGFFYIIKTPPKEQNSFCCISCKCCTSLCYRLYIWFNNQEIFRVYSLMQSAHNRDPNKTAQWRLYAELDTKMSFKSGVVAPKLSKSPCNNTPTWTHSQTHPSLWISCRNTTVCHMTENNSYRTTCWALRSKASI